MSAESLGIVAIGRNEGERLRLCLQSICEFECPTIYVDSNSSDNSVSLARGMSVTALELDPSKPCSAARARHEGFRALLDEHPDLEFVFFVDGDCQVELTWPERAVAYLVEHQEVAAVCGRRREQHPDRSVYNRLCDLEWDTPIGEAAAVGGDAVYRVTAYNEAGGFNASVPAGEEPELCKRIRDRGWKIWRLDAEMTRHDAAMTRFGQWWMRQIRTGYAGYDVERRFGIGIFDRIIRSAWFWGGCFPLVVIVTAVILSVVTSSSWGWAIIALAAAVFCLQSLRIGWRKKNQAGSMRTGLEFGLFTMIAKVPILLGVLRQIVESSRGKQARIVEYKSAESLRPQP